MYILLDTKGLISWRFFVAVRTKRYVGKEKKKEESRRKGEETDDVIHFDLKRKAAPADAA